MDIKYVSVSDVNRFVKIKLENEDKLQKLYVKAEISNFKRHTRGHLYLTLKDDDTRISAIMFSSNASSLNFEPKDGDQVLITGRIGVYEATGNYQIYITSMELDGIGNLYLEYEKLKKKLETQGMFALDKKKAIPKYPKKIGIVTASTGAAIRDILTTIKRRYPIAETILFPTLVQGTGAAPDIVESITKARDFDLDVLIVGRGGGSIEDLWAFNEEIVAYAIYESSIPIISAVGHEVDFTIADFVADLRAPTPTAAAEMAVPNILEISNLISQYKIRLNENINNKIFSYKTKLDNIKNSYVLNNPLGLYEAKEQKLDKYIDSLNNYIKQKLDKNKFGYEMIIQKLELLNPLNILSKGYSVVKKDNKVIKSIKDLNVNELVDIKLFEGEFSAKIERIGK